jgi:phage shock protein C
MAASVREREVDGFAGRWKLMTEPQTSFTPPQQYPPAVSPRRQLRRSREDKVLAGVCGGLGRYLGIDPVILRVLMVVLIFAGVGILLYVVAWIVIPEAAEGEPEGPADAQSRHGAAVALGAGLIGLGGLLLLRGTVPWFESDIFWPLLVVAGGVLLVISARR